MYFKDQLHGIVEEGINFRTGWLRIRDKCFKYNLKVPTLKQVVKVNPDFTKGFNSDNIQILINNLRNSDEYIKDIYLQGGCYRFYKLIKTLLLSAVPYKNKENTHVVSFFENSYYDITGKVFEDFTPLLPHEEEEAKKWSFKKHRILNLSECEYCGEPFKYE